LAEIHDIEGLMVWIMNQLADTFGNHAVLKGGMQLRLVDCPRFTNDLDYVFIPFSSKKDIKDRILEALKENPDIDVSCAIHSKCIRYFASLGSIRVQLEVNVAMECESQELTTASLARQKNQQGRIIRAMRFSCALAHKLAAWTERGLIRDLYDVYYMAVVLNVLPDQKILLERLSRVQSRQKGAKKTAMTIDSFIEKLEMAAASLTRPMVDNELRDYMRAEELPGLDVKIIGGIRKVIDALRTKNNQ
jgi:predicted nucleotidyltransferase component of viral defense system